MGACLAFRSPNYCPTSAQKERYSLPKVSALSYLEPKTPASSGGRSVQTERAWRALTPSPKYQTPHPLNVKYSHGGKIHSKYLIVGGLGGITSTRRDYYLGEESHTYLMGGQLLEMALPIVALRMQLPQQPI